MRFHLVCAVVVTIPEFGSHCSSAGLCAGSWPISGWEPSGDKGTTVTSPVAVTHAFEELRATLAVFSPLPGCG